MEKLVFFALGFLTARWLLMSSMKDKYLEKEKQFIDRVQNGMHDLLNQATNMSDMEISERVLQMTENEQGS